MFRYTVGYGAKEMVGAKYNIISLAFNSVGGEGLDLNTDFNFENLVDAPTYSGDIDHLEIWIPGDEDYEVFFRSSALQQWVTPQFQLFSALHPDGLPSGTVLWYYSVDDVDAPKVTQSGEVLSDDSATFEMVIGKYNMLANPYPVEWNLNDADAVDLSNAVGAPTYSGDIDHIEVWTAEDEDYATYFFSTALNAWCNTYLQTFETVADPIQPGDGVWYYSVDQDSDKTNDDGDYVFDITFFKPF